MPQNLLTDAEVRNAKPQRGPTSWLTAGASSCWFGPTAHGCGAGSSVWPARKACSRSALPAGARRRTHARDAARALVAKGISPAQQRPQERRTNIVAAEARRRDTEGAFGKVAEAWLEEGEAIWADGTYRQKRSRVSAF